MWAEYQFNQYQFSIIISLPLPCQQFRGQKASVIIGLIEFIEPLYFAKYFTSIFIAYNCMVQNLLCGTKLFEKLSCILYLFYLVCSDILCHYIKGSMFLVVFV